MKVFDVLLAMLVAIIWGFNFAVIEAGLVPVVLGAKHSNSVHPGQPGSRTG